MQQDEIRKEDFEDLYSYYEAKYEEFDHLLGVYFALGYHWGPTDEKVIQQYLQDEGDTIKKVRRKEEKIKVLILEECLKEGREVLKLDPFPFDWIMNSANRALTNIEGDSRESKCRKWVTWILDTLEKEAKKQGKL